MRDTTTARWARATRRTALGLGALALGVAATITPAAAETTGRIAVCLTDSSGANVVLGADQAWVQRGSINYVGAVGDSGCRESTFAAGTEVTVWAGTEGTRSQRVTRTIEAGQTAKVDFFTTKVTIQYPGSVAFGGPNGDSRHFKQTPANGSRELLTDGENPTVFRLAVGSQAYARTPVTWPIATGPGKSAVRSLVAVQVLDGAGNGLPGVSAQHNAGGGSALFWVKDTNDQLRRTGADGLLAYPINGYATNVRQVMGINNTTASTTTDVSAERLTTFRTTTVSMNYNHLIRYRQGGTPEAGQTHYWLTRSGMELFPGSYSFEFQVPDRRLGTAAAAYPGLNVEVSGDALAKTVAAVRLTDSTGAGLKTGQVSFWRNSAWHNPADAATDGAGGSWIGLLDGAPGNITYRVNYEGAVQTLAGQNLATASVGHFQTVPATLQLVDHAGNPLDSGSATFFGTSWRTFGDVSEGAVTKELLPIKHSFRMNQLGSQQTITVDKVSATPVVFQTGKIVANGAAVSAFYTNNWQSFPADGVELLPGNVTIRYADGTSKSVTVTAGAVIDLSAL